MKNSPPPLTPAKFMASAWEQYWEWLKNLEQVFLKK